MRLVNIADYAATPAEAAGTDSPGHCRDELRAAAPFQAAAAGVRGAVAAATGPSAV
jgi:hypothetical protein